MQSDQSSITAENNALLRAYESMRPENDRICYDPYAVYFMPDRIGFARDRYKRMQSAIADWETHFPGVCNSILARTRFVDDCLREALRDDIRQVVILGAGYDTRAFRFEALGGHVAVFELDHPATQKRKLEKIRRHLAEKAPDARYIPIDFSREDLAERLPAGGYDDRLKTFFIWEGVTYYVPASTVDRTLGFIKRNAPPGSPIVFDCFPPSVAEGTTRLAEARALREGLKRIGEEILFGIEPGLIDAFMQARGFTVVSTLTGTDCMQACFQGPHKNRPVSDMFIFVQAMVACKNGVQYQPNRGER